MKDSFILSIELLENLLNLKNNQRKSLHIKLDNEMESVEIAEKELAAQVQFVSNEGLLVYEATKDFKYKAIFKL